jgi:hypothetical protein
MREDLFIKRPILYWCIKRIIFSLVPHLVSKDKSYFRFTIQRQNIILTEETQLFTTTYFYEKGL